MTSVGETLRSARESQARGIAEIAEELCITQRYLRALECDDLSNVPGTFFYKSFVRQYASVLGVPMSKLQPGIDAIVSAFEPASVPEPALLPPLPLEVPTGPAVRTLDPLLEASNRYFSNRRIGVPVAALGVVLLACSGFYSWWNQPPSRQRAERAKTPVGAQGVVVQGNVPHGVEVSAVADPNDANHVVLNVSATESTWLSITTSAGEKLFSGILQPSQSKTLTAAQAADMKVGNAGGIEVRLNGKEIGPLGGRGQVRTVRFTAPDKYEFVEPIPTPQPPASTL